MTALRVIGAVAPRALRPAVVGCASLLASVALAMGFGVGLPSRTAGCYAVLAACGAFCLLVAASRFARPRALGMTVGLAGWTVIAPGSVAGTIGFFPLGWIVMGALAPGSPTEQVAPGLVCETSRWGMAASASGYVQHIYETWPLGLRREVASLSVMQTDPPDPETSCPEAYRRYRETSGR